MKYLILISIFSIILCDKVEISTSANIAPIQDGISSMLSDYNFTCLSRFLQYVKIDTQSNPLSTTYPSTLKQLDLSRILVEELQQLGMKNVIMDEKGYVSATLEATSTKQVPTIAFISHLDTSFDISGKDVNPIIHYNYQGGDIVKDGKVIVKEDESLRNAIGKDIVTTDGTTLLGADDKAGKIIILNVDM